jgi:hypothetical protein
VLDLLPQNDVKIPLNKAKEVKTAGSGWLVGQIWKRFEALNSL